MRPFLAVAVLGLVAAAVIGAGKVLGAWDAPASPASAGAPPSTEEPTVSVEESGSRQETTSEGRERTEHLPAAVVRKLDALCRSASADALAIAARGRPTSKEGVRRLFEQLDALNETYNRAAIRALAGQADDPRVRTLARLFDRDEGLFDELVATIAVLETPAGRARFRQGLEKLQRVGKQEERVLAALGVRACDASFVG